MEDSQAEVGGSGILSKKYGLSWIVYVKSFLFSVIFAAIVLYGIHYFKPDYFWWAVAILAIWYGITLPLRFLSMRAMYVFMDERGVWLHSGILPWTKGKRGIIWNDCGGAVYYQGFFAYILKTYTIAITHKYTESAQIVVSGIYHGKDFCAEVSDYIHKTYQANDKEK
ncbi:hypothetical protein [Helicobacter sp.]|uniref:hypothetical protein n=1 Tax=Helicobacter sp. TaxID=218 RepID=UPI0025B7AE8A|nr:hypothetical protein [Helicobacter sp.]MCI5632750.1 hypothetical protein [Helicobacter sp.]